MKLTAMLLLPLLAASCATAREPVAADPHPGPTAEAPESQPAELAFERTCPDLPATRPDDLVVRFELHDYQAPENLGRWTLHADGTECPPDDMPGHLRRMYAARRCVPLTDSDYDALYAELARHRVDHIRTRAAEAHPHRGGTAIVLGWGTASCRVADIVHDTEVHPDDRDAYRAADNAIRTAVQRALEVSGGATAPVDP